MNIKKTIITATVALTMVAMIAPMTAGAMTVAELQAQINALMAQLQMMQPTTSGSVPPACVGVTFNRNLTVGSTGQDVKCFQVLLNSHGYVLAASGAGSPGMETSYFGPRTLASVRAWQVAQGWTPANQVGPLSRAMFNSWLTGSPVPNNPNNPNPTPTGPVSAMLSSDTPASGDIVAGQATADLTHVTFMGSGVVTSLTLQRSGVSDQNTLTNVYLFDGNTRITDGYAFNVNGMIVINGLSVAVTGSKTLSVRADVLSTAANTASSIAVAVTGYTANGVSSTTNVMGNKMYVVVGNLASATITTAASSSVPTANVNAGTTGYTFWSAPLQVNTRTVWLKMANFRMIGSAPIDALGNLKLFIDGIDTGKVGTTMTINGSNYAVFDLNAAPITLMTGSHTIDLRADVQKGTNRTVQVSVQNASDLTVYDPQVKVNVAVSSTTAGSFSANNAGTITILTGSVTVVVDPTFTAQTTISGGAANTVIGKFRLHAYGEDVKVNSLKVIPSILSATTTGATCTTNASTGVATGTCGLNNVTLYFNGSQVGSQTNYASASMGTVTLGTAITFTLGSQLIIPAGMDATLEVRADLQTVDSVAYTGGTVKVGLPLDTASVGQGMNSFSTLLVPTAAVATNGLTISTSGLAVSKNTAYLNQAIAPNMPGVKIGSYVVQNQSTSQSIRLTSLSIATTITTTTVSNFSALRTSDMTGSGSTPVQFSGTSSGTTSTDVFSVSDILAPGASMTIDVFANTGSATSGTIATTLNVSSIGAIDNISTTSGIKTGQTLTLGTGSIASPTIVTASTTPAQFIAAGGGATSGSQAVFNFVSTSGASTITELKFTVTGSDAVNSQTVTNVCVGSVCAQPVSNNAYLTGLNLTVPNGGSGLTVTALVSYSTVGTTGIASGKTSITSLTYAKYTTGGSTKTVGTSVVCTATIGGACDATISTGGVAAPSMTLVGSKPTVTVGSPTSVAGLNAGAENKIGEVTVTADAKGNIKLNDLKFTVASTNWATLPTFTLARIADGNTTITGSGCGQGVAAAASQIIFCEFGTTANTFTTTTGTSDVESNTDYDGYTIAAGTSKTFSLFATVSATSPTTGVGSISTSLVAAGFNWDDTASAVFNADGSTATTTDGTNLTGSSIYNFPTNSYSRTQ
ncbi:hypothetical protein KW786_02525 [Candidatus Parcubacteria bacterium]|nr:hypothetical protein [Candidatus Parcubacteria bacterium]